MRVEWRRWEKAAEVCCAVLLLDLVAVHVAVAVCGIRAEKGAVTAALQLANPCHSCLIRARSCPTMLL